MGQGKTTTIISLIQQLPKEYKVVLLKNEYGDVEGEAMTNFSLKNMQPANACHL